MDPRRPVDAAARCVDLADPGGQACVLERPRATACAPARRESPTGETSSTRHISVIECSAFFAAMNPKILTGSRSPWRRRPRLFSGSRAPRRGPGSRAAAGAAPRARRVVRPSALPSSTSSWRAQLRSDCGEQPSSRASCGIGRPLELQQPHRLTPGTPANTAASLASTDILPARPDGPAVRCPRNRGNSIGSQSASARSCRICSRRA